MEQVVVIFLSCLSICVIIFVIGLLYALAEGVIKWLMKM